MVVCKYCQREFEHTNKGSLVAHENYCEKNPNRKQNRKKYSRNTPAWNKGLTKETDSRIRKIAEAVSSSTKGRKGRKQSIETRKKLSEIARTRYESGWMPKAGRCRKFSYISTIAGAVSLDGTWELKVAYYLDEQGINWRRNTKKFTYFHKGKKRTYTPDFYIVDRDVYLEIKGYETDLDKVKWSQFPGTLEVWRRKELVERCII